MLAPMVLVVLGVQTRVTFASPARPVPEVIRALGEASGLSLRAAPLFASQIVAVRLKDMPVGEAMDRLAVTLGGTWVDDGRIRRLERPAPLARERERNEQTERIARIKEAIANFAGEARLDDPFGPAEAKEVVRDALSPSGGDGAARRAPLGRLVLRLLTDDVLMAATQLAPVERAVWATRPHPSQRAFSASQQTALKAFVSESTAWQRAVASASVHSGGILGDRSEMATAGDPARTLLVVQRHVGSRGFTAKLLVADRSGRIFGRSILNFNETPTVTAIPAQPGEAADLGLSEAGQRWARLFSDPWRTWNDDFAATTRRDPLAEAGDLLVRASSRRRPNVIAVLPDALFRAYPELHRGSMTSDRVLTVAGRYGARFQEDERWATITPDLPLTEERLRTDRAALERLLARLAGREPVADSIATYVAESGEGAWQGGEIDRRMVSASFAPRAPYGITLALPSDALALACHGTLTGAQRRALAEAGPTLVGRLPVALRTRIERMAYRVMGMRLRRRPPEDDSAALRDLELSLATENTEVLPRGLPADARLTLTRSETGWEYLLELGRGAELRFRVG